MFQHVTHGLGACLAVLFPTRPKKAARRAYTISDGRVLAARIEASCMPWQMTHPVTHFMRLLR